MCVLHTTTKQSTICHMFDVGSVCLYCLHIFTTTWVRYLLSRWLLLVVVLVSLVLIVVLLSSFIALSAKRRNNITLTAAYSLILYTYIPTYYVHIKENTRGYKHNKKSLSIFYTEPKKGLSLGHTFDMLIYSGNKNVTRMYVFFDNLQKYYFSNEITYILA